ncbi:cell division GTPase [Desulfosporosinus acidiphilus SJ4]|uniref:Cell division GTPase n=1 Tax=Desulfosporosinus acidiphilus (strain DSM 22704 / JCM 16185 / SJ4) TaxID=646529 RepID=I4D3V4_DESAJ|nr:cell division protein FtsZ [Desulfosporosinus acidiphilus]AFM40478.1 cell division GTPase [Desulfosporosinus acidiphilus SJ4]
MAIYTRPPFIRSILPGNSPIPFKVKPTENEYIEDAEVVIMENVQSNQETVFKEETTSIEEASLIPEKVTFDAIDNPNENEEDSITCEETAVEPSIAMNNLDQESFILNSTVSINFGIIGLGQAGGKIADSLAACRLPGKNQSTYQAIAVNTCLADLHALKNIPESQRVALPNYRLGAMRQPELGYAAINQPGVLDDLVLNRVPRVFENVDHVIVSAGIGGGTGTGGIQAVCEALAEKGYSVTAMITLPRNLDSVEEKQNANVFLGTLQELMYNGLISSVIVVDNNLLYNRYVNHAKDSGIDMDWKIVSNMEIVRIINEMNATTGLPSSTTFDGAELTKILTSGGCVTFGKARISLPDSALFETIALEISEILNSGYLAEYKNLSEARYAGVQLIMPPDLEFGPMMERTIIDELKKKMPTLLGTYVGHAQVKGQNEILVYTVVSGMGLPGRAQELSQLLQAEVEKINASDAKRTQFMPSEVTVMNPFLKGSRQRTAGNPFAKESPIGKANNPFGNKQP